MASSYGKFVLAVALSPLISIALGLSAAALCSVTYIFPGTFCSRGGGIGDDNSFIAICNLFGVLGWVVSLPVAGVLGLLGWSSKRQSDGPRSDS
jgi:hypothetical protein